jgi:drug/metabolite transporter (DMT)-like permease
MSDSARSAALRGIGWMVLAAIGYSLNAGIVRQLSGDFTPYQIVFWRSIVAVACLLPWLVRHLKSGAAQSIKSWKLFLLRALFTYLGMATTYYALANMPIAEVYALQFTLPIFTILGAVIVFKERAGSGAWIACAVGFAGTLIILRPGFAIVSTAALVALASAVLYAASNVAIKKLAQTENATTITLYGNLIILPMALAPALFDWHWPTAETIGWIIALGVFTTLGQWALTRSIGSADARIVWPFDFLRLPFTVAIGYVMFAQVPGPWTWVGAIVIFCAAYYVIRREAKST